MARPYPADESLISRLWTTDQLLAMHDAFAAAMQSAGYVLTEPSSRPGTQTPVVGYRRVDM